MEEIKIINVKSIQEEETNFNEDSEQNDVIIIDSDDENEDLDFIKFEVRHEDLETNDVTDCVEVDDQDDQQIEHINLLDSDENECQDWRDTTSEEDPLALDLGVKSCSNRKEKQNSEREYTGTPTVYFNDTNNEAQEEDIEIDYALRSIACSDVPYTCNNTQEQEDETRDITSSSLLYNYITKGSRNTQVAESVKLDQTLQIASVSHLLRNKIKAKKRGILSRTLQFTRRTKKIVDLESHNMSNNRLTTVARKKLRCSKCGKAFKSSDELLKHIDTHAVGKIYFCEPVSDHDILLALTES